MSVLGLERVTALKVVLVAAAALILSAGAASAQTSPSGTLDANTLPLECVNTTSCSGVIVNSVFEEAQTFTAINSGNVTSAQLQVEVWAGTGSEDLVVQLATVDSSGAIGSMIPGASATVPGSEIPRSSEEARLVTVSFDNPPAVQAGKKYALIVSSPSSPGPSGGYVWLYELQPFDARPDQYPQGDLFRNISGGGWEFLSIRDMVFAIYVEPSSDTSAPQLDLPGDMTVEATSASGAMVTFAATATDENPANPEVNCSPASGSTFPIGTTQVNCSATDAAGNEATGSFDVTVRDTTAPTISGVPTDITKTTTSASGAQVSYASPSANDAVDGSVPVNCSPASSSTFALGETTVSCSASDARTNTATKTFKVSVLYDFGNGSGGSFGEPVRDTELNQLAAGAGVPVKFGLGADYGLNIFAAGYPTSRQISCSTGLPTDPVEETAAVTKSGLTYDAASGLYTYVWKTERTWKGTCRELNIKLADGSNHPVKFQFR